MYCTIVLVNWLIAKCNEHSFTLIQAHSFTHTHPHTHRDRPTIDQSKNVAHKKSQQLLYVSCVARALFLSLSLSSLLLLSKNSSVYYF